MLFVKFKLVNRNYKFRHMEHQYTIILDGSTFLQSFLIIKSPQLSPFSPQSSVLFWIIKHPIVLSIPTMEIQRYGSPTLRGLLIIPQAGVDYKCYIYRPSILRSSDYVWYPPDTHHTHGPSNLEEHRRISLNCTSSPHKMHRQWPSKIVSL